MVGAQQVNYGVMVGHMRGKSGGYLLLGNY